MIEILFDFKRTETKLIYLLPHPCITVPGNLGGDWRGL
jgi:hypothetical protein